MSHVIITPKPYKQLEFCFESKVRELETFVCVITTVGLLAGCVSCCRLLVVHATLMMNPYRTRLSMQHDDTTDNLFATA